MEIKLEPIGRLRTPYRENPPHQGREDAQGEFVIELNQELVPGLDRLAEFSHIHVLYHLDRVKGEIGLTARPPMAEGLEVGIFASRTPRRPNPVGLSVVRLLGIRGNRLYVSGLDALDGTPVIDIKPYIPRLDLKPEATSGWIREEAADDQGPGYQK